MGAHNRPINELDLLVQVTLPVSKGLQFTQNSLPNPRFAPALKETMDRGSFAIEFWQVSLQSFAVQSPLNAVPPRATIHGWAPSRGFC